MFRHYQDIRDVESQSWGENPSILDFFKVERPICEDRHAQLTQQDLELRPQSQQLSTKPRENWLQSRDESRIPDNGRFQQVQWSPPSFVVLEDVRSGDHISNRRVNIERVAVDRYCRFSLAGNQVEDSTLACSEQAAKKWKICLPRPDLPKFLRISSPTSPSTEGSGAFLDNMMAKTSASSCPRRLRHSDQQVSSEVSPTLSLTSGQLVTDLDLGEQCGRLNGMTPQTMPRNGEVVFPDSSSILGRKRRRRISAASSTTASECDDTSTTTELTFPYDGDAQTVPAETSNRPLNFKKSSLDIQEKHTILQAATALLMLLTSESIPSTAAASAPGLPSPRNGDFVSDIDESEQPGSGCSLASADAVMGSVLPRPCTKRRYRLVSDLMAETSRLRVSEDG